LPCSGARVARQLQFCQNLVCPTYRRRSVRFATLSPTGKALELAALLILTDPFNCPVPRAFSPVSAKCACIFGPSLHALDRLAQLCAQGGCWPHRTGHTGYDLLVANHFTPLASVPRAVLVSSDPACCWMLMALWWWFVSYTLLPRMSMAICDLITSV